MKKTIKVTSIALAAAIFTLFVSCTLVNDKIETESTSDKTEISAETLEEKVKQWTETMVSGYGAASVQYAVMDHGEVILSGGQGFYDRETEEEITKNTMFGIASISKMYVSTSVMVLVDEGKVDIDQPVTKYIEEFTMADERYKDITVRMLLNHSSGLYGSHYGNTMLFDDVDSRTQDNLLASLKNEKLKSNPGAYSVYCNDGFQLLEILVERVSGKDYSAFISENISEKLDLNNTKTPVEEFDRENLAKTYFPGMESAMEAESTNLIATGGVYSTAEEVAKFAEVLMGKEPEILTKESAQAMANEEYKNGVWVSETENTVGYGLGYDSVDLAPFSNYGIKALNKGGDSVMYHGALTVIPEHQLSVVVLSSGGSSIFNTLVASNILEEVLYEKGIIEEILPAKTFDAPIKVEATEELNQYNGVYAYVGKSYEIAIENSEIKLPEILGGMVPESIYTHVGDGRFKNADGSIEVSFDEQINGKTYLKVNMGLNFPGIGQFINVYFDSQKIEKNVMDEDIKSIWESRNKKYYSIGEKVTSAFYLTEEVLTKDVVADSENGYAMGNKIVDANTAVNVVEIPVMNGRDAFDLVFYNEGDREYMRTEDGVYISEDNIYSLSIEPNSIHTIKEDGYAMWFKVDEASANRTITITSAVDSGFAVYNGEGMAIQIPNKELENMVTLPEGGMIVFVGEVGSAFEIKE